MRERRSRMAVLAAILATLMLASVSPLASAAPVRFGAKLDDQTQPDGGTDRLLQHVPDLHLDPGRGRTSDQTGSRRPRTARSRRSGSSRATRAAGSVRSSRASRNGGDQAKVVRRGPLLTYVAQPDLEESPYQVQVFTVNLTVKQG